MRLGVSDGPRDLSPGGAANLLLLAVTHPGPESGNQAAALVRALGKGLERLVLLDEVWALLGDAALEGGRALPHHRLALGAQGQGQQWDHTPHHTDTRITYDHH